MWLLAHGEHEVPTATGWLTSHERAHLESIRFTKRRTEYLTRRWTTKQAVATVLDLDRSFESVARIEVRHHESGAPFVLVDGERAGVDVSMSDRSGWAVCLVGPAGSTASGTLGIDLEVVEPRSDAFVADFFTVAEHDYVRALGHVDDRHEAANLIWSAKEAALKVQQVGLRVDTRTVEVELHDTREARPDGWRPMTVTGRDGAMPGWWRRDGVFLLTIAFAAPSDPPAWLTTGADLAAAVPRHSWVERPVW
jgi:4'-phosphopantetheinyl transferase